jgi:hypothetical protein
MSRQAGRPDDASGYAVRVNGHLDERWSTWIAESELVHEPGGTTVIRCRPMDQAALHGLLRQIRDAGLPLISVSRLTTDSPPTED